MAMGQEMADRGTIYRFSTLPSSIEHRYLENRIVMTQSFETQLDTVIFEYDAARAGAASSNSTSGFDRTKIAELRTRCIAAIERASDPSSTYYANAVQIREGKGSELVMLAKEIGVARALLADIRNGYLQSVEQLTRSIRRGPMLQWRTWRKPLRMGRKSVRNAFLPRQRKRHARHCNIGPRRIKRANASTP